MIESPVRESQPDGNVERSVRNWRDPYRTMRHHLDNRMKKTVPNGSPLSTWLATWAADMINKYRAQSNVRKAYELTTQHKCKHVVVGFGEKVHFQHIQVDKNQYKKDVGMFLGVERCNTYLIGTSEGIYASPHIMKFQDDQAYVPSLIGDIKDRFYDYLKGGVKAPPATIRPIRSALMPANPDIETVPVAGGEYAPRKARITKEDLIKHGYTPGCPGCIAAQGDGSRHFRSHTDKCRRGMIELLPETRQTLATDRSNQWIAEQVEKSDATMDDTRAPLQGASATASGSGFTNAEAIDVNLELEHALGDEPGLRNRVMTPERHPAVRRPVEYDRDAGKSRRRR